jgi:hypothetical protein
VCRCSRRGASIQNNKKYFHNDTIMLIANGHRFVIAQFKCVCDESIVTEESMAIGMALGTFKYILFNNI